jgi:hypothetical protein
MTAGVCDRSTLLFKVAAVRAARHPHVQLPIDDAGQEVDDRDGRVDADAQSRIDENEQRCHDVRNRISERP